MSRDQTRWRAPATFWRETASPWRLRDAAEDHLQDPDGVGPSPQVFELAWYARGADRGRRASSIGLRGRGGLPVRRRSIAAWRSKKAYAQVASTCSPTALHFLATERIAAAKWRAMGYGPVRVSTHSLMERLRRVQVRSGTPIPRGSDNTKRSAGSLDSPSTRKLAVGATRLPFESMKFVIKSWTGRIEFSPGG